jgi:N-acetylmuramoyl-L-alanine amidase
LAAEKMDIKNIRVASSEQTTRIVFDTSGPPKYKIFTLNNPSRVVIDISNAQLATSIKQSAFTESFVNQLRYAEREGNKLRLVLDLNQASIPKSFILPASNGSNHRLVIDLKSGQKQAITMAKVSPKAITQEPAAKPEKAAEIKSIPPQASKPVNSKPAKPIKKQKPTIHARELVIAIDPGHGGKDPGAIGYAGTQEKKVVLQISQRLAKLVNAEPGMRAVLTRNSDKYLTLRGRMKLAREKGADLFVSVHADAVKNRKVRGSSVYVLSKNGASSEAAQILAKKENSVDTIGGVKLDGKDKMLQKVIVDLSQSATIDESVELASYVRNELKHLGKTRERIESAGFAVLKSPDTPSILVETAFISNPGEEKKLRSSTHQQRLAASIFRGIKTYFHRNAPADTRYAHLNKLDQHTIKSGETLSGIAIKYRVSLTTLRDVNALKTDKIRVGQKLIIPASS